MSKQWVAKRKIVSLSEQEAKFLATYSEQTGRTETEVMREALRQYQKAVAAENLVTDPDRYPGSNEK